MQLRVRISSLKTQTLHLLKKLFVLLSQLAHAQSVPLLRSAGLIQQRGILHAQCLILLQVVAAKGRDPIGLL
jgi:hypothetical protein